MAPLQIGVMMENVQLSDITCIDCLGNASTTYVKVMAAEFGMPDISDLGTDMVFHYISSTLQPAFMTPSVMINPTTTYDDAPRDLDILLIGGPPLSHRPEAAERFMKEAVPRTKIVMSTCVGGMWLASSGVLKGKKATTNRGALEAAKGIYPDTDWLDQRWVVDGKFWTAGGAGAGIDMVATYALQNFNPQVAAIGLQGLDFDPAVRGQFYAEK
ncbi:MAG: hypothetical protein M4579_006490 [Chaenotheca gracillima]|nr:MAG: hypothetical protein M4579_006490 [Chaenotheca gracillima]